jgi:hypothetical protein
MPIERDEAGVGELRRGTQLAGAERGRRTSDPGEVGFDRIKTFGQRQGSREARVLDAEAGLGGNPARVLELVGDEAVSAGWERLNGRHGRGLYSDGSEPNIARHLAFVIPGVAEVPKPFHSGDVAFELCYLHDMPAVLARPRRCRELNREMWQQLDAAKTSGGFLQGGQRASDGGKLRSRSHGVPRHPAARDLRHLRGHRRPLGKFDAAGSGGRGRSSGG